MRCGIESKNTYKLSLAIFNQESEKQVSDTKVFCKKCSDLIYTLFCEKFYQWKWCLFLKLRISNYKTINMN